MQASSSCIPFIVYTAPFLWTFDHAFILFHDPLIGGEKMNEWMNEWLATHAGKSTALAVLFSPLLLLLNGLEFWSLAELCVCVYLFFSFVFFIFILYIYIFFFLLVKFSGKSSPPFKNDAACLHHHSETRSLNKNINKVCQESVKLSVLCKNLLIDWVSDRLFEMNKWSKSRIKFRWRNLCVVLICECYLWNKT